MQFFWLKFFEKVSSFDVEYSVLLVIINWLIDTADLHNDFSRNLRKKKRKWRLENEIFDVWIYFTTTTTITTTATHCDKIKLSKLGTVIKVNCCILDGAKTIRSLIYVCCVSFAKKKIVRNF